MSSPPPPQTVSLFASTLPLSFIDQGKGRHTYLLLHGGGGSMSMQGLATALTTHEEAARVITPIHPGFSGTPHPPRITRVDDLVLAYLALLDHLQLANVIVVGNSLGGWVAAELGLRHSPRIAGVVLMNAVGIDTAGTSLTILNPATLTPPQVVAAAFHDPAKSLRPSTPEQAAQMGENQKALRVYAGEPCFCSEPTLKARLADMRQPAMVVWGASDRIVTEEYGRMYAQAIPGARFELVHNAGHFPHMEQLGHVLPLLHDFANISTHGRT